MEEIYNPSCSKDKTNYGCFLSYHSYYFANFYNHERLNFEHSSFQEFNITFEFKEMVVLEH